jgi:hypothetical protein
MLQRDSSREVEIYSVGKVNSDEPAQRTGRSSFPRLFQPEHPYCTVCSSPPPLVQHAEDNDVDLEEGSRVNNLTVDRQKEIAFGSESNRTSGQYAEEDEEEVIVRSRLMVTSGLCCYSEVPTIKNIIFSLPRTKRVKINITTKMVYVDHQSSVTTASSIVNLLNSHGFSATILSDGGAGADGKDTVRNEDKVEYIRQEGEEDPLIMPLHWNIIVSGVFWVISMLSLIGGPWLVKQDKLCYFTVVYLFSANGE